MFFVNPFKVRLHSEQKEIIKKVLQIKKFNYENASHFVRAAINYFGNKILQEQLKKLKEEKEKNAGKD